MRASGKISDLKLAKTLRSKARRDTFYAAIFVITATVLGIVLELEIVESVYLFTRSHEDWELDDVMIFFFWLGIASLILVLRRLSDIARLNAQMAQLAYFDTLCEVPNRNFVISQLELAVSAAHNSSYQLYVLFIDLDNLKLINDLHGHAAGDIYIKAVAQRVKGCLRQSDLLGRLGGDEFLIILRAEDTESLSSVLSRLINVQQTPINFNSHNIPVSFSVGAARFPEDGADAASLIRSADQAMYRAKQSGKGCLRFASADTASNLTLTISHTAG